ncbi:MAG: M56 family metallopeptidase [Bacteroidales bacterium]|nr:M56 family metallopeptidase [Bacteroidales bacterium]
MNAQQLIIGHLLPIGAAIAVLWLAYRLLFINSNRLRFNRLFLLAAMLFSLVLPLLGLWVGTEAPQVVSLKQNLLGGTMLGEIVVTPGGQTALPEAEIVANAAVRPQISVWQVLAVIYLIGVGVAALLFLFKLGKLVALVIRSPKEKREGYTAVFTGREQGSFSFFRYAFFPNENVAPDIIRHELSHIGHRHSWDILFVEVLMVLQWFNPFIYLYKKELQSLHEYQADRDVVATGADKKNYMMLILQQCTAADFSGMSNNFSLILTKKRIKMITKNEKAKGLWWRLLATLPVLAILLIANTKVTAQEQSAEKKPITVEMGSFEIYDDDGFPIQLKDTVIYNEDGSYVKCVTSDSDVLDPNTGEPLKMMTITTHKIDGTPADYMNLHWEINGNVARYTAENFSISTDESLLILLESLSTLGDKPENDSIYQIVDEMPQYPGGEAAMMKFVANNVKYPQEAKDKEIQGRVFVSFVIEKDGSVNEVKVQRSIGGGCDEEAVRVIKGMPKWKPGKQEGKPVRVSYMMPINFKLSDGQPAKPSKKADANKPDMKPDKNGVYQIVEEMPQFPSGETKMMEYIAKNINYPQEARDKGIEGRVFIGMVIEKDGSVSNVRVLRGIGGCCDEEAVRVISSMPKWKPGKVGGEPVPVSYMLPVNFKLQEKQSKKK